MPANDCVTVFEAVDRTEIVDDDRLGVEPDEDDEQDRAESRRESDHAVAREDGDADTPTQVAEDGEADRDRHEEYRRSDGEVDGPRTR